jgi:hypothetical protein
VLHRNQATYNSYFHQPHKNGKCLHWYLKVGCYIPKVVVRNMTRFRLSCHNLSWLVVIMCLTVPDFVSGVQLLVSGGRSVLFVHKAMNHIAWARVLLLTRCLWILVSQSCRSLTSVP